MDVGYIFNVSSNNLIIMELKKQKNTNLLRGIPNINPFINQSEEMKEKNVIIRHV